MKQYNMKMRIKNNYNDVQIDFNIKILDKNIKILRKINFK